MAGGQGKAKASAGGSSRGRGKGRGNGSLTRGGRTNSNGRGPSTLGEAPPQNNTGGAKTSLQGGLANGRGELSLPSRLRSTGDNSGVRGVSSHDSRSTKSVTRTSSFPTSYPPSARATTSQPLQFQLPSQPRRQQQHQPQLQVQTRAPPQPQTQGQPQAQPPPEPQPNPEPEDDIYEELYPDEDLDVEDEFDEAVPEGQDYEQLLQNLMALPGRAHLTVLCEDPIPIGENTWKFNGPFFSWKVTPIHIRERWFRTLLRKYNWESGITEIVRSHFDWIVKKRLKGIVSQIKNRGIRPEAEFGRPVSYGEVFMTTHTRPDGSFVDQKAKQMDDCYEKELQEVMDQQASDGPENSSEHSTQRTITIQEKNAIFLKCTETDNRGNPFGLGQLKEVATKGKRKLSHLNSSESFKEMQHQLQNARRKIEEQEAENARRDAENARRDKEHKAAQSKISKFEKVMLILQETNPRIAALLEEEEEEPDMEPTPTSAPGPTPATATALNQPNQPYGFACVKLVYQTCFFLSSF